jgi:hypothetical protein
LHEEDAADVEATPFSTARISASTAYAANADEAPMGMQDENSGDRSPDREADGGSNGGDKTGSP